MMWPVLTKVQYEKLPALFSSSKIWVQIGISVALNWIVGPFVMLGLAWATLPDLPTYRTGVIMVGIARCIAMVMIWNTIAKGHVEYCAILVVFNAVLQIALYSPYAVWFINVIGRQDGGIKISYGDVAISVLIVRIILLRISLNLTFIIVSWYSLGRWGRYSIFDLAHRRKTIPSRDFRPIFLSSCTFGPSLHNHRPFCVSGSRDAPSHRPSVSCVRTAGALFHCHVVIRVRIDVLFEPKRTQKRF